MRTFITLLIALCIICAVWCMEHAISATYAKPITSTEIYEFTIIDEHELQLTNSNDTISLLLENTYVLIDQNPIIIIKR